MAATMAATQHLGLVDTTNTDSDGPKLYSFAKGDMVVVTARTWPGINKPGGVGRIILLDDESKIANVKYSLGGTEKNITFDFLTPWNVNLSGRKGVAGAIVEGEVKRAGRGTLKDQKYEIDKVPDKKPKKSRKMKDAQKTEDSHSGSEEFSKGETRKRTAKQKAEEVGKHPSSNEFEKVYKEVDTRIANNANAAAAVREKKSQISSFRSFAEKTKSVLLSQNDADHKKRKIDQVRPKHPRQAAGGTSSSAFVPKLSCETNKTHDLARKENENKKERASHKPLVKKQKSSISGSKSKDNSLRASQLAQPKSQFPSLWQRAKDFTSNVLGVSSSCDTSLISSNASSQKASSKANHPVTAKSVPKTLKTSSKGQEVSPLRDQENRSASRNTAKAYVDTEDEIPIGAFAVNSTIKPEPKPEENKHFKNFVRHMQRIMTVHDDSAELTAVLESMQKDSCSCPEADAQVIIDTLSEQNKVMFADGVLYLV
jgi:hypothetical protein